MAQREEEIIAQEVIEQPDALPKVPSIFLEEWIHILPGSTNEHKADDLIFKDPYAFCRDVEIPDRNGYELC